MGLNIGKMSCRQTIRDFKNKGKMNEFNLVGIREPMLISGYKCQQRECLNKR